MGDYFAGDERRKWLGVQSIVGPIVATSVVLACGFLGTVSWRAPFAVYAVSALCFIWLWLGTWEPQRGKSAAAQGERRPEASFPWAAMLPVYLTTLVVSLIYYVQTLQLGLALKALGAPSTWHISVAITIASLGVILGGAFYRKFGRIAPLRLVAVVLAADALGYAGLNYVNHYTTAVPICVVAQFGNGLTIPTLVGWALSRLPEGERGRGMGLWISSFFVAIWLSPMMMTFIEHALAVTVTGAFAVVGWVSAALAAAAWLASMREPADASG
jgi:hypothetical protein